MIQVSRKVALLLLAVSWSAGGAMSRPAPDGAGALDELFGNAPIQRREAALRLHPIVSSVAKARRSHPAPPVREARMVPVAKLVPPAAGSKPDSASGARQSADVLPGLPNDLVAVVEGGAARAVPKAPVLPNPSGLAPAAAGGANAGPAGRSGPPPPTEAEGASAPVALTVRMLAYPGSARPSMFLPFERKVGAAAFVRGRDVVVVFDAARPLDLSSVQDDPLAHGSSIQLLSGATILRLPEQAASTLALRRLPAGWLVQAVDAAAAAKPIKPTASTGMLRFPVDDPGRTVVVPDPQTGGNLLVGTLLEGQDAVDHARRSSVATIERTLLGIVVDPLSDRLELYPTADAFLLSGFSAEALGTPAADTGARSADESRFERVMSLEPGSSELLDRRFKEARAAAAASMPQARFLPRMRAAEDALALGDAVQAQTIIQVAIADDPHNAPSRRPRLIETAAALLGHQPVPGSLLDDPAISTRGEFGLWRGFRLLDQDAESTEAARLFAANLALLQGYPSPLQALLLPRAAECLARAGTDAEAGLIDGLPMQPSLDFARALLAERRGQTLPALTILDRLASDPALCRGDEAAEEAVSLREKLPSADLASLSGQLNKYVLDARICGHDLRTRFHLADLRMRAAQWSKALGLLREIARLYPDQDVEVRRRISEVLKRLTAAPLTGADGEAFDQASMIEANADMLPSGADGDRVSMFLASRLSALDLPERVAPLVQQMMRAAQPGPGRAELGLRLAGLELQLNKLDGVQSALQESDPGDLPPDREAPRRIVLARALAAEGQLDQALVAIATLQTAPALELRADLLSRRGDWVGATDTLAALARQRLPAQGMLDPAAQDLLLRLASVASRTNDRDRIKQVRETGRGRLADPAKSTMFQFLTSDPGDTDAPKSTSEAAALRQSTGLFEPAR